MGAVVVVAVVVVVMVVVACAAMFGCVVTQILRRVATSGDAKEDQA
jgi:hypothetical protein